MTSDTSTVIERLGGEVFNNYEEWENSLDQNYLNQFGPEAFEFTSEAFEAGAASRQTEIDELQKRIDKALEKCYTGIRKQGGDYYLELIEDILKGNQNDRARN